MQNILVCTYDEQLLPEKKTPEAIAWDIRTATDFTLQPWELKLIPAGIKTVMPVGRCCKIYARSSLPCKTGLMLWNSVALIDSDYRGEYFMQIYNFTNKPISIEKHKNTYKIIYKCLKCNKIHKNIIAKDDDYDKIISLSVSLSE